MLLQTNTQWFLALSVLCFFGMFNIWLSICRNGALGPAREWKLKDCIAVHKLLDTVLLDSDAASSKH